MKNILITGGAGFIGSHLVKYFVKKYSNYKIINLDSLTYAGNLENLRDIEKYKNYKFVKADITDTNPKKYFFISNEIDSVINLAAESHVDRSIKDPFILKTNIFGTLNIRDYKQFGIIIMKINYFIMFQQMRFMVL